MSNPQPLRKLTVTPGETYHDRLDAPALSKRNARLRRYLADLPDAEEFAFTLGERALVGLRTAWRTPIGWRVERGFIADLQRIGLCEACGPFLTNFGVAVRLVVGRDSE